jgi:nitrate reductase assembly molybdenum cofactor insertion protein NarJ
VWEDKFDEMSTAFMLFNFIKAASFCQIIADEKSRQEIAEDYRDMATDLMRRLHENNKNYAYIFPRFKQQTPHAFYTTTTPSFGGR